MGEPTRERCGAGLLLRVIALSSALAASAAAGWLLLGSAVPLGVPNEWVWNRVPRPTPIFRFVAPSLAAAGYIAAVLGWRRWSSGRLEWWNLAGLPGLFVAGAILQWFWLDLPQPGLGMERVPISLSSTASSGYFHHARREPLDTFLGGYEDWIAKQDRFHIGTHPPGLFLLNRLLLDVLHRRPAVADVLLENAPRRLLLGYQAVDEVKGSRQEMATVAAVALLTWGLSLATLFPVYLLTRLGEPPATAWLAAAVWPTIPGPMLFFPVADCLFPFLACAMVWLVLAAGLRRSFILGVLSGLLLWSGMMLSLAFVALLPIPGLCLLVFPRLLRAENDARAIPMGAGLRAIGGAVVGWGACCAAMWLFFDLNLLEVWRTNLSKHAGFYEEMPRSYWTWLWVNVLEFGVVCGPAVLVAAVVGAWVRSDRSNGSIVQLLVWSWLATVFVLNFSGKNLSEVGRLWLFLTPFAAAAFAWAADRLELRPWQWSLLFVCQIGIGFALQATVEPLLPIAIP